MSCYIVSDSHWWPWLLLPGAYLIMGIFMLVNPIVGTVLGAICFIIFFIFMIVWNWKMFVKVGRAGWWALIPIIGGVLTFLISLASPLVGVIIGFISMITYLVLIGVAAWGNSKHTIKRR